MLASGTAPFGPALGVLYHVEKSLRQVVGVPLGHEEPRTARHHPFREAIVFSGKHGQPASLGLLEHKPLPFHIAIFGSDAGGYKQVCLRHLSSDKLRAARAAEIDYV